MYIHSMYIGDMPEIEFEWDPRKAAANQKKHAVSFEEAATAFYDEDGFLLDDPDHSDEEDRFVLMGMSSHLHVLVVVHAYRGADAMIRIISARKATPSERDYYRSRLAR